MAAPSPTPGRAAQQQRRQSSGQMPIGSAPDATAEFAFVASALDGVASSSTPSSGGSGRWGGGSGGGGQDRRLTADLSTLQDLFAESPSPDGQAPPHAATTAATGAYNNGWSRGDGGGAVAHRPSRESMDSQGTATGLSVLLNDSDFSYRRSSSPARAVAAAVPPAPRAADSSHAAVAVAAAGRSSSRSNGGGGGDGVGSRNSSGVGDGSGKGSGDDSDGGDGIDGGAAGRWLTR
ncbi:unnamed protein product, partial [Phaeothamnion confervicola]